MNFDELAEFRKDLKGLQKRFRTLNEDLQVVKQVLEVIPDQRPPFAFSSGSDHCHLTEQNTATLL